MILVFEAALHPGRERLPKVKVQKKVLSKHVWIPRPQHVRNQLKLGRDPGHYHLEKAASTSDFPQMTEKVDVEQMMTLKHRKPLQESETSYANDFLLQKLEDGLFKQWAGLKTKKIEKKGRNLDL